MIQFLQQEFGIFPGQSFKIRQYDAYYDGHHIYILIKVYEQEQEELQVRYEMTNYLRQNGEKFVPAFFAATDGRFVKQLDENYYIVLKLEQWRNKPYQFPGRRLAYFHNHGKYFRSEKDVLNRLGKWKELWESRIDRLEKIWQQNVMNQPNNDFERLFIDSFPYYAGMTENAIQYFVDTTIDEQPTGFDVATVCHERFTMDTWTDPIILKDPFDWIVDHPVRDIAEWIRHVYFSQPQMVQKPIQKFIQDYETQTSLSPFAWRLLYSRLVLPIHYFQCIELYYARLADNFDNSMTGEIKKILNQSGDYERFLAHFYDMAGAPHRSLQLPKLDWFN
ncbi:spore coat protein YutH [Caldibacillus thermoamylovorans]|uniref:Spore coat protein YutH n=1 Tax=Caldibacillus thermoamylovorans TaxID=35841 RepID=A0A090J3T3_9BACI|nr:spore coat protein YutH [Caldibacillus thermoamylovorans]CEE02535.1 spore coat protein YutH [Caldibacillus thermoamylovorans]